MRTQTIAFPNSHSPRDTKLTFNCTARSRHSQHIPHYQCQIPVLKPVISRPADARGNIGMIGDLNKSIIVVTPLRRRTTEENLTVFWIDVTCGMFVVPGSVGGGRCGAGRGCIGCIPRNKIAIHAKQKTIMDHDMQLLQDLWKTIVLESAVGKESKDSKGQKEVWQEKGSYIG